MGENMVEIELIAESLDEQDNLVNVEMSKDEIWFLKKFIKKYNPKKILEIGVSAGGNTVNLLKWKDNDAILFSIDIAEYWYRDNSKLSGFMVDELCMRDKWQIYRGYDYLDVYKEIGNDVDFIIIDTVHTMPGEILTFLAALPQLKDGCVVVLHDIHLNMVKFNYNQFSDYDVDAYCTGLLFAGISSTKKWSLKSDIISNIGAFIVDEYTRENIKDIFHILCSSWHYFPKELNLTEYSNYFDENYSKECSNLFNKSIALQKKYFDHIHAQNPKTARLDILNSNSSENTVEFLSMSGGVDCSFPRWFKKDKGNGAVIHADYKLFDLKFKCVGEGVLNLLFRGPDVRNELGVRIPHYVTFNNVLLNNENIINNNVKVWHDEPYTFKKNVYDGEIIEIHVEWDFD